MDFFLQISKELDQQVASIVRTISRRGVSQIQSSDEAQLLQLVTTLATISQTARDSFVWRCGLVTVCGDDPGVLMPSSPLPNENISNNNNISSPASVKITPLDSRISVISRLTDLLSLVYVAHTYFTSSSNNNNNNNTTSFMSDHQTVFKKNHIVTFLAVVAGACDVPFLPQGPVCSVILETLNSCLHDFLGVVHAEHSVNNAIITTSAAAAASKNGPCRKNFDQTKFPRKLPLTFSIHAHRYLLKSLSRRIFQPLYASWLISALGSPENLSPFPGNNNNNNNNNNSISTTTPTTGPSSPPPPQVRNINNPFSSSATASLMRTTTSATTQAGGGRTNLENNNNNSNYYRGQDDDDADFLNSSARVEDDDGNNNSHRMRKAQSGMNGHSCFLKDAIIRIICGGFLGDGPVASPHSYVAVALNVLSTLLLIPLEDGTNNNNNNTNDEIQKSGFNSGSSPVNEDHSNNNINSNSSTTSLVFDKRAPQIFGARSVDGMSTIIEALIRRNLFRGNTNNNNNNNNDNGIVTTPNNQGFVAAASLLNLTSVSAVKRLMKFFWTLRPLIQSLTTCSVTKKSFMNAPSTKNLLDLLWKTINAMIEVIDSVLMANDGDMNSKNNNNHSENVTTNAEFSSSVKQQKIFQAVGLVSFSLLPIAVALWRGMNVNNNNNSSSSNNSGNINNNNRGFSDTIFLFAQRAASILIPPPIFSGFQPIFFSSYRPTSQENIIAFDCLVHAVEFAASIETTPVLKNWLTEANSDVCSINTTATSLATSSSKTKSVPMQISAARHIQLQWSTHLIALGIEDTILRCVFSSAIGMSPESDLPPHLLNLLQLQQNETASCSSSTIMMIVLVDTALRDAVSQRIERKNDLDSSNNNNSKISSPDMIFGALSAVGGSPLNNPNQDEMIMNDTNSSSCPAHPVLRRALLRMASLAADEVSCKDVCRVLLRSNQGIGFISWISSDENAFKNNNNINNESYSIIKNKSATGLQVQEDSAVVIHNNYINNNNNFNNPSSSVAVVSNNHQSSSSTSLSLSLSHHHHQNQIESGLTASLRIELVQQKSLNFDLERELQKRSNEATIQDAKIRALHETLNSIETDNNQQKVATDTMQEILDAERQQKINAMTSENNLRHEMAVMAQRLRELEQERQRIQNQAQNRIDEAERRAHVAVSRLNGVERELEGTREQLVASEDRVNKFVALHNTFAEMTRTV